MKSSLHDLIPFLPLFSITFDCRLSQLLVQLPTPEDYSILILAAWEPRYIPRGGSTENTASIIVAYWFTAAEMCLPHFCVGTRAARTTENVALLLLHEFASALPLPSNELFRLSGVMSQYFLQSLQTNSRVLPQIRPRMLSSTSFPIHYSPFISPFDDIQSQLPAAPLNKPYINKCLHM
jgi:hypothetical protein